VIQHTWRAGPFSSDVPRDLTFAPPSWARAGKSASLGTGAAASITPLALGFLAPASFSGRRRCWSAPLFYAARHFGSATCIGNPPDPS